MSSPLVLRPLTVDDEAEALAAHEELAADGFDFLLFRPEGEPWADYVARTHAWSRGEMLEGRLVASDLLVGDVDGVLVGRASIRHELGNEFLATYGGHVGYGVRPAFRRRGHAAAMLRGCLTRLADLGVERALVTCDPDNLGSARVIESCGGVFDRLQPGSPDHDDAYAVGDKLRYWVPTGV
mgnify:CR=1 FL=1